MADLTAGVEPSGIVPRPQPPILLLLPDPDARIDPRQPVLGRRSAERLAATAIERGFEAVHVAPGVTHVPVGAVELATGEPVAAPALVAYETSYLHPELLGLMVEHPLDEDERFSIYDDVGRPVGWFTGHLDQVPSTMPMSEELELPEHITPTDLVRFVYPEDRDRVESLVLRSENVFDPGERSWHRYVGLPTLRLIANSSRPLTQIELVALLIGLAAGALVLSGSHAALIVGGLCLLVAVVAAGQLRHARLLRVQPVNGSVTDDLPPGEGLSRAIRPLAQAATTTGLTYLLVAETNRSSVAGLVLLAVGVAAVLLSLAQARRFLQHRPADAFTLPNAQALARRLGVRLPPVLIGAPLVELAFLLAALPGVPELPWAVLATGGLARLWRWFAAPAVPA